MTPSSQDTEPTLDRQAAQDIFRAFVQQQVRQAIRATLAICPLFNEPAQRCRDIGLAHGPGVR